MTNDVEPPAKGGLITQRMAAERGRGLAITYVVVGSVWLVVAALAVLDPPQDFLDWFTLVGRLVLGVAFIVLGIGRLRSRARRIARFDTEHGADAGVQPPVSGA